MVADFNFVRKMRLELSELYRPHGDLWCYGGVNWRTFPAWIVGWAPTIGSGYCGTIRPKGVYELYFVAPLHSEPRPTFSPSMLNLAPRFFLQPVGLLPIHTPEIWIMWTCMGRSPPRKSGSWAPFLCRQWGVEPCGEDAYGKAPIRQDSRSYVPE